MNKTRIEWCDYTINPVKGLCPMHCKTPDGYEYCYAAGKRGLYKRFKWDTVIRFDQTTFFKLPMKPSRVFVGSTIELFGEWVKEEWLETIFTLCRQHSEHTFIFLTKQPQNLMRWSPFPDNCWVGMTVTKDGIGQDSAGAIPCFEDIEAKVKFISFEPLLERIKFDCYVDFVNWVVIGQQTPPSKKTSPKMEWVKEVVEACDKGGIPVFLKNNLMNMCVYNQQSIMLPYWALNKTGEGGLRQEYPVLALEP